MDAHKVEVTYMRTHVWLTSVNLKSREYGPYVTRYMAVTTRRPSARFIRQFKKQAKKHYS